jgi:hypothetical protein
MGSRFGARALIVVLLAVSIGVAIGYMSYSAGVAHGLDESGRLAALPSGSASGTNVPYVYVWPRPWGFGFGFFPFFFILLWFFLLRGLFWGGRRGWRTWDGGGVPPRFEEWHRRAHEQDASLRPAPGSQQA